MIRALWFFLKVGVLVAVAVWFAAHPGAVSVTWEGYVIETSVGIAAGLAAAGLAILYVLYRLVRGLVRAPARIADGSRQRRRDSGYRALTRGMVAVAAGDAQTAQRMARRADVLLDEPPLTMLLSAQAAQLNGDDDAARRYFLAMLERPETAFLGLRGLLTQSLRADQRIEALDYARKAHRLQPSTPWLQTTLFDLEARAGNWSAAEEILRKAVSGGSVTPEDGRHHRAVLYLEQAAESERNGRLDDALSYARSAHGLLPGFVPAAERAARLQLAVGNPRRAARILMKTWRFHPHPDLARLFARTVESGDPLARLKAVQKFAALAPAHVESHIAIAAAALDARLWGEARGQLAKALAVQPSRRIHGLLAALERGEKGDELAARDWLAQGASAPADPAWTCRSCGSVAADWAGRCPHCGAFDTLDWRTATVTPQLAGPAGATAVPTVIEATRPA
jgi:HemY protein